MHREKIPIKRPLHLPNKHKKYRRKCLFWFKESIFCEFFFTMLLQPVPGTKSAEKILGSYILYSKKSYLFNGTWQVSLKKVRLLMPSKKIFSSIFLKVIKNHTFFNGTYLKIKFYLKKFNCPSDIFF